MRNVEYECRHRWVVARCVPVMEPGVVSIGGDELPTVRQADSLAVVMVCSECERHRTFESQPLDE